MNIYGTLSEVEYSPSLTVAESPLSVSTIRAHLRLPELAPDVVDDQGIELQGMSDAAVQIAEEEWDGDIRLKQYVLVMDCWPACEIRLRRPLVSVDLVRYRKTDGDWVTLTEDTDYIVDLRKTPGIITLPPDVDWPTAELWPSSPIEVYFSAGFATAAEVPYKLRSGMLMLVAHWYTNKVPTGEPVESAMRLIRGNPRI